VEKDPEKIIEKSELAREKNREIVLNSTHGFLR